MNENLFRKSSIDRVSSPEQLNQYIQVARPSVWITLAAIILLLVGAVIWGIFGTIDTRAATGARVENGTAVCYVDGDTARTLAAGMEVAVGQAKGTVQAVSQVPEPMPEDSYLQYYSGIAAGNFCYAVQASVPGLPDGTYAAELLIDSIHPFTFVIH